MPCVFSRGALSKLSLVLSSKNAAIYAYTANSENYYQALFRYVKKCLKTLYCNCQFSIRKKCHPRLLAVLLFPFTHCQKSLIFFIPGQKILQNQAICSQTGKNATSQQLCLAVFSLYALSKICICTQFKNLLYCTICPNNWAFTLSQSLGKIYHQFSSKLFSSKSISHLFSTLSQQLWVGW